MLLIISLFLIFLCYGSFLNVVAYRLITDKPFMQKRSTCNYCNKLIAWYDNIPVLSWLILRGKCRHCKKPISILYPFIELLTAVLMTALFYKIFVFDNWLIFSQQNVISFVSYFIFFTALIVATRTDLQAMVIPQIFTLWLIPFGFIFSILNFIDVNFWQSGIGIILGYGGLWLVARIFKVLTKKDGLGVGDMELLGLVGAFLGPVGVWFSVLLGSISGLLIAGTYILLMQKQKGTKIPFGPFLVLGAVIYFFFGKFLIKFLL
jgi:leader peptidase (prepilin peptidase) / N-methyltransferase